VGAPPAVINAIVDALHRRIAPHRYAGDAAPCMANAQRNTLGLQQDSNTSQCVIRSRGTRTVGMKQVAIALPRYFVAGGTLRGRTNASIQNISGLPLIWF